MPRMRAASSSVARAREHAPDVLALDILERYVAAESRARRRRGGDPLGERVGLDQVRRPEDRAALHRVAQLAHVARPRVVAQHVLTARARASARGAPAARQKKARKRRASAQDVLGPLAQRRHATPRRPRAGSRDPRGSGPPRRPRSRSRLVAATTRTSARRVRVSPTRSNSRSCRKRRSFAWSGGAISPISSRKSVPPSAASTRPGWSRTAPVKAPRAWPKSSLASSSPDSVGQFTTTNGPLAARALRVQRARERRPCRCRSRRAAARTLPTARRARRSRSTRASQATRCRGRSRARSRADLGFERRATRLRTSRAARTLRRPRAGSVPA